MLLNAECRGGFTGWNARSRLNLGCLFRVGQFLPQVLDNEEPVRLQNRRVTGLGLESLGGEASGLTCGQE